MGIKPGKMENMVNKKSLKEFFSDKKVFITGHTGFKGSWLISILKSFNAIIKGYSLDPFLPKNLYSIVNDDHQLCQSVINDIRDEKKLREEIINFAPDIIFHLAAQPLVRYSYEYPLETFQINTMGTANLLDTCRFLSKKCAVIVATTDKVYENIGKSYAYKETDSLGGFDPYSSSKAAAEVLINSYYRSFFNLKNIALPQISIASVRSGNVIGGGDWSVDRIIPDIIRALESNQKIKVRNPAAIRPWQHVLDPLIGYLYLAQSLYCIPEKFIGAWNFGPFADETFSVIDLVKKAIKIWGKGEYEIISDPQAPHEARILKLNIDKSLNILKWKPLLNAELSIEWTINWYKTPVENQKANTLRQIQKYLEL
jgi:CDP-glucose 4,6-dehydratase